LNDIIIKIEIFFYYNKKNLFDKIQAKFWYEKAANNVNIIAKDFLKKNYVRKLKVDINKFKLYKVFFLKKLSQCGLYYFGKMLLITNNEKSFIILRKQQKMAVNSHNLI
jgi:hypothetical protein